MSSTFYKFFSNIFFIDIVIFLLFCGITFSAFSNVYTKSTNTRKELIVRTPEGVFAYDMSENKIINLKGAIGISRIEIIDKSVHFLDSPCPNKTCTQAPSIFTNGDWSACLPNQIFLSIESNEENDVDVIAK